MCREYRMLRPYFSCDFYPLENSGWSYAHGGWAAYRYDRPEAGDGIVMVFRRAGSNCELARYPLEGLDPGRVYTVTDIDSGETAEISGSVPSSAGLEVAISAPYRSRIFIYKAK